jgi:hypothetical protein
MLLPVDIPTSNTATPKPCAVPLEIQLARPFRLEGPETTSTKHTPAPPAQEDDGKRTHPSKTQAARTTWLLQLWLLPPLPLPLLSAYGAALPASNTHKITQITAAACTQNAR